jgi:List-Bact-rpt repeat protein/parallel beta helix pectate lyase-like protein/thrombospondin type 3 repeat protein
MKTKSHIAIFLILLVGFMSGLVVNSAVAGSWKWSNPFPTAFDLNDVWTSPGGEMVAVGEEGTILFHDGAVWSQMNSNTTIQLNAVWGSAVGDVYAVGVAGTIMHYDGVNWTQVRSGSESLDGVWGSASDDVYAVGDTTILHFDGTGWSTVDPGFTIADRLWDVWGASASNVFIVGEMGVVYRYNGSTWEDMSGISGTQATLVSLWGATANKVFAAGSGGTVIRYDGGSWNPMIGVDATNLRDIWGTSGSDVFVVGTGGTIWHYDAVVPDEWMAQTSNTSEFLTGVSGTSGSDVVAVGAVGTVQRYDGTWTAETDSLTQVDLYGVWGAAENEVFAVGGAETILFYDGAIWMVMETLVDGFVLRDVAGNSSINVYAVGDSGLASHYDGTWGNVPGFPGTTANLNGVWVADNGEVFVVGTTPPLGGNSVIFHYDGITWELQNSGTTNTLHAVWGTSETNVFAVGNNGIILQYDGVTWSPMNTDTITTTLTCVWGSSDSDVFASGQATKVYRYDGNVDGVWTEEAGVVEYPFGLWGTSGHNVYAVGGSDATKIEHFDGSTWQVEIQWSSTPYFYDVWGSSKNNIFAVGGNGMILNYTDLSIPWTIETVDSVGDVGRFSSLKLDAAGNVHIAYLDVTNDALKYATNASGAWVTESLDSGRLTQSATAHTPLALDYLGNAHISYYDGVSDDLKYATNASGAWVLETVDIGGTDVVGTMSAITVDDSGTVHIAYRNNTQNSLMYATGVSGGPWDIQTVNAATGGYPSLAVDSSGDVHIAYQYGFPTSDLMYATNATGSWVSQTLDSTDSIGSYNSLVLDDAGNVHIAYWAGTLGDPKYATNASGSFVTETIDSRGTSGYSTSLALDSNGDAHVSWADLSSQDIMYATSISGSWETGIVDDAGGAHTSIGLDTSDMIHITYFDETNLDLKHARSGDILDTDSDGLEDNWEIANFGDLSQVGSGDGDEDMSTNLEEFAYATNPTEADTDRDGYYDREEIVYGTNPLSAQSFPSVGPGVFYVDADAPNLGDGSPGAPWRILHHAIHVINGGTGPDPFRLNVMPGTYTLISNGGNEPDTGLVVTQDNFSITGDPGAILEGVPFQNNIWQHGLEIAAANIVVSGLEVRNFFYEASAGILITEGNPVSILNCVLQANNDGVRSEGTPPPVVIINDCEIFENSNNGISIIGSSPNVFANRIYDNNRGIYVGEFNSTEIVPFIYNNLIYYSGTGTDMQYGVYLEAFSTGSTISPMIFHNTINGVTQDGIYIYQEMPTTPNIDIKYNSITYLSGYGINNPGGVAVIEYNCFWSNTLGDVEASTTPGTNNIYLAPLYIDYPVYNFQLQSGSPCQDAIPLASGDPVSLDISQVSRPQGSGFDIGAYESVQGPVTQYTLTVTTVGQGTVSLTPAGGTYNEGTQVGLSAIADEGWAFSQWSGDLVSILNPDAVIMDADKTIVATFVEKTSPDPPTADSPAHEAMIPFGNMVTLDTSDYNDPDGDSHVRSHWEVWRADTGEYLSLYPLASVTDLTSHEITDALEEGLKYYWQVSYEDADGNLSESQVYSFKIGTSEAERLPEVAAGQDVGDFGMISIVHWPDNPSPTAVFNIDYDPANYRIGTYDAMTGSYIEFGEGLEMEPGRCYWILAREGLTVNFNGIPVSLTADVYVALDYNTNTNNGWNMVAPPNDADYYWRNVQVVQDVAGTLTPRGTLESLADDNPYIDRRLWRWENGDYVSDTPDTDFNAEMTAYAGYWVEAKQANVFLMFEPAARVTSLGMPQTMLAQAWHKTKTWLSNLELFDREAIADNDRPPMPPAGLDENSVDPVIEGCYIETINK